MASVNASPFICCVLFFLTSFCRTFACVSLCFRTFVHVRVRMCHVNDYVPTLPGSLAVVDGTVTRSASGLADLPLLPDPHLSAEFFCLLGFYAFSVSIIDRLLGYGCRALLLAKKCRNVHETIIATTVHSSYMLAGLYR